jgi:Flp pilus assembly protein TadG
MRQPRRQLRARLSDERGSVTVELVLVTPLLILFLLFVVALGRLATSRIDISGAAAQAARAASIARDPTSATAAAQQTATAALADDSVTCANLAVSTNTADFVAGGTVKVTITCNVDLADLAGLRIPASTRLTSSSVSSIDAFRETTS